MSVRALLGVGIPVVHSKLTIKIRKMFDKVMRPSMMPFCNVS